MVKPIFDTPAGRALDVDVIMRGKRHVATVRTYRASGGTVTVEVWQAPEAAKRSAAFAARYKGRIDVARDRSGEYAEPYTVQRERATGYGYDKATAALCGMVIDGHPMGAHCGTFGAPRKPKGRATYPRAAKCPDGYRFANYVTANKSPDGTEGYMDCYRHPGTSYLAARGYTIISAL